VTRVLADGGRVHGVEGIERGTGIRFRATAPLTVGADGRNSTIARAVDARPRRRGAESSAFLYGYYPGLSRDRYRWVYRPGVSAGVVPTNDGMACVWAGTASDRFTRQQSAGPDAIYRSLLAEAAPELARSVGARPPVGTLRAFPGQPGWIRASAGPGWALVGDAGYFKDPITAHGITDALRDAELLAQAVLRGTDRALAEYESTRDELSRELFEITDAIAGFEWDLDTLKPLHLRLSRAMNTEVEALVALDVPRPARSDPPGDRPFLAGDPAR